MYRLVSFRWRVNLYDIYLHIFVRSEHTMLKLVELINKPVILCPCNQGTNTSDIELLRTSEIHMTEIIIILTQTLNYLLVF